MYMYMLYACFLSLSVSWQCVKHMILHVYIYMSYTGSKDDMNRIMREYLNGNCDLSGSAVPPMMNSTALSSESEANPPPAEVVPSPPLPSETIPPQAPLSDLPPPAVSSPKPPKAKRRKPAKGKNSKISVVVYTRTRVVLHYTTCVHVHVSVCC